MGWLLVCCCSWVDLGVGLSFGGVVSLLLFFGDLVVGLCFGSWVDVGVGFSFGGVALCVGAVSFIWMLICFCELVDVGVGFSFGGVALCVGDVSFIWMLICFSELVDVAVGLVGLFFEEWCRRLVRFTGWALRCERSVQLYTSVGHRSSADEAVMVFGC